MILIDTGPLVAVGDRASPLHDRCVKAVAKARPPRLVPSTVVAEVCYMLSRDTDAATEARFLRSLGGGFLTPVDLVAADYDRAAQLVEQYADFPLGGVDASLIAVAERLDISVIATLDHRHFRAVRPRHVPSFTLVPEDLKP